MSLLNFCEWLAATPASIALHESRYLYLAVLTTHVMTLFLFIGVAVAIDLRLIGFSLKTIPVSHVDKVTVFLCSTYSDLVDERQGVLNAIRQLQLQHESMEYFGARPGQPIETCLAEVAHSNVLVVVVGYRYGSFVPGKEISFSEAEYREG